MFNFKPYFKFLGRNKLYTFVNVVGLSVSLMFVILIASYTVNEFTTDKFHENADQIYVLSNSGYLESDHKVAQRLKDRYYEIEKTCGVQWRSDGDEGIAVEVADNKIYSKIIAVDSTFLDMFSFELLSGDRNSALEIEENVLLSESFARKVFGSEDPIGQSIVIHDDLTYTVSGVIEDFKNSIFKSTDIIMRIEYIAPNAQTDRYDNDYTTLFFQTIDGSNLEARGDDATEFFKTFYWVYTVSPELKASFIPMRELYFNETIVPYNWNTNDRMIPTILVLIGVLILMFAVVNYVNLTVAQTGFRAKEVATRKLFGASKSSIFMKMIFESLLLCFVAFLLGLLLAFAFEPYASIFINKNILFSESISIERVAISVIFITILGVASGVIPALIISRFRPIDVVKGTFTLKSKMIFSKIFITIQSVITIILIACSLTIYSQVDYLINYDYGYNNKTIIDIPINNSYEVHKNVKPFKDGLMSLPSVKSVGITYGTPFETRIKPVHVGDGNNRLIFKWLISDSTTVKMFGFNFLKDNNLAESGWWVNRATLRKLEATDELKSFKCTRGIEYKIAGIIEDFQLSALISRRDEEPLKKESLPLLLQIDNEIDKWNYSVLVEIQGDLVSGYNDVKKMYAEFAGGREFEGKYIYQQIEDSYIEQRRMQMIMVMFSIVAIIISSLGLLAISSYFIQQRSREIAIRKVFGSTRVEVLTRVVWEFMRLVFLAFVIACPIVWYVMGEWLNEFAYRIDMSVWILLAAGIFNMLIAFFTVYWQSNAAVNTNPIKSIMR